MPLALDEKREFKVGTTGWTVDDLDDPVVERLWELGRYEIIEGVLAEMSAAYHDNGRSTFRLGLRLRTRSVSFEIPPFRQFSSSQF